MTTLAIPEVNRWSILSGEGISSPPNYWQAVIEQISKSSFSKSFSITEQIENVLNFLESKNCEIRNEFEIRGFLINHSEVIQHLRQALDVIFKYFGQTKLNLELVYDPEIEDKRGELFLNIVTNFDPEGALRKLDEIDRVWLIPIVNKDAINFNLNLEFQ